MEEKKEIASQLTPKGAVESTLKVSSNRRKPVLGKIITGSVGLIVVIAVILGISIVLSVSVIPSVKEWLVEHDFIQADTGDDDIVPGTREVVVEENWVTTVVEDTKKGVVSVAVSEVSLDPELGTVENSQNIGTGFVIDSSGLILTNQHVVSGINDEYVVISWDGKEYPVTQIARDDINDLAILKVETTDLEALPLGESSSLQVGQFVVAIGTPLGDLPGSVTTGVISGLGRSVTASSGGFWGTSRSYEDVIQTDAAVNPGNSGGPLLDVDGAVIGINFATTSGADNISFAIPIDRAKEQIEEFKAYGKFIKPYLGVEYQLISQAESMFYQNVVPGALVKRVVDESPAEKAGVQRGDIITKIDGEAVLTSFTALIQGHEVGDEIELEVWRNGEALTLAAVLEESEE